MKKYSFYRPHKRVTQSNDYLDPVTGEVTKMPSMTKQEFQRECDINNIVKSFSATGMLTHVSAKAAQGAYLDLPEAYDFQAGLEVVKRAQEAFSSLPSLLRARFDNNPAAFLAFCQDPANVGEMRILGLATPAKAPNLPAEGQPGGAGGPPPAEGAKAP